MSHPLPIIRVGANKMLPIQPIGAAQQEQIKSASNNYIALSGELYKKTFGTIDIRFDLKGRAAGMYQVKNREHRIRYNPYIFAKYFEENLTETVPHEVAHYITDMIYGIRNIRPHGKEWQALMQHFGANTRRTFSYDLSDIPQRQYQQHRYRCHCQTHTLSSIRHNKILRGTMQYFCKKCGTTLVCTNKQSPVLL
ncbi:MAG TPA: metallopeptidase (SprT family) [Acidiferrobacteraceae bacterium]|nr:metallopeptidase (SprT family) [Acidiferrobacteraceae bacterium]HEX19918.1 metallopeptidase (SprT family) [Acidiferrobacteraceae bacterium]